MPMISKDKFKLMPSFMYAFFGVCLMIAPQIFWEASAPIPVVLTFWKGSLDSPATTWWARAFGTAVFSIAMGPFLGMNDEGFFKQVGRHRPLTDWRRLPSPPPHLSAHLQVALFATLGVISFLHMILTTEDVVVEWMWWCYMPVFASFAAGSAYFLKPAKKPVEKKAEPPRSKSPAKSPVKSPAKKKTK